MQNCQRLINWINNIVKSVVLAESSLQHTQTLYYTPDLHKQKHTTHALTHSHTHSIIHLISIKQKKNTHPISTLSSHPSFSCYPGNSPSLLLLLLFPWNPSVLLSTLTPTPLPPTPPHSSSFSSAYMQMSWLLQVFSQPPYKRLWNPLFALP